MLSGASWTTWHKVFSVTLCNVVLRKLRQHWKRFFLCNVVRSLLDNMAQGFFCYFVQCCPKKIKTTLRKILLVHYCLQPQRKHYIGFFLWNIAPKVLTQHCTGLFPVQFYLQPLGQHCIRFLLVQYCPKSIRTTLNRICPIQCCLEPLGQHCTRFLLCNVVPRVLRQHWTKFFLCNVAWRLLDNIAQGFYLCAMLSQEK